MRGLQQPGGDLGRPLCRVLLGVPLSSETRMLLSSGCREGASHGRVL